MSLYHILELIESPHVLISSFGLIGIIVIVFLETGFVFGFFFPGDSLLFTAGLLAAQGHLSITGLMLGVFIAAVIGDTVGYAFGKKVGPSIFAREKSVLFSPENLAKAQHFYEKYGPRTIIIARFVPVVRTFAPIVAGIGNMDYKKFLRYNVIGAALWVVIVIGLGYGFGRVIPDPDRYLLPAIGVIVLISAVPAIREFLRHRRSL